MQATPTSGYSFSLKLPTQPGTYYLRWGRSWEYSCTYNLEPTDETHNLAVICVY